MKRTAILVFAIAALCTALLTGGAVQKAAATTVCTDWLPTRSDCSDICPSACATIYNDTGGPYSSQSYAYRHSIEVIIHNTNSGSCLPPNASIGLAYVKTNGAWKWSWTSPKGWCGGALAADSGSYQCKVLLFYNGNGAPPASLYASVTSDTEWS